jgi:DNA ligase (NAD+)
MNKEQLKKQIINANNAYRKGNAIMSDSQFDELVDKYKELVSIDEYNEFRDSLNESSVEFGTKIKHKYVMGSLDKIKNSDNAALLKFIKTHVKNVLNISAKVDGISSVAYYKYGKLVSLLSRGNGYEGMDYTDKAKYINGLPDKINFFERNDEIYIRGELVILDSEEIDTDTNYRNICAGYMNSKYWNKEDISKVSFIPYSILGDTMSKRTQFEMLKSVGFNCAWNESIDITNYDETTINDLAEYLTERAKFKHDYSCDGLVLMDWYAHNEQDVYRPKNSMAFKINELTATTRIIDIDWGNVSKDGFFIPVAVLEPIELGGSIISRVTLHNLDILEQLNIDFGDTVEILKSGDIIPHIIRVIKKYE